MSDNMLMVVGCMIGLLICYIGDFITDRRNKKEEKSYREMQQLNAKIDMEVVRLFMEYDVVQTVNNIIDEYIMNYIDIFMKLNVPPSEANYINAEQTKNMRVYIMASLKKNLPDTIIKNIKLCYNIKDEESLDSFLKLRTNLLLLEFLKQTNS